MDAENTKSNKIWTLPPADGKACEEVGKVRT